MDLVQNTDAFVQVVREKYQGTTISYSHMFMGRTETGI